MRGRLVLAAIVLAVSTANAAGAAGPPLTFVWPTSLALEPSGSLLVVENGLHRLVRVDPRTGKVSELVTGLTKPYAVARSRSGTVYFTDAGTLLRLGGAAPAKVATAPEDVGPLAVAPNGDVWFTTSTKLYRVPGGTGRPAVVVSGLGGPHGLAVTSAGTVLVSDTDHNRVLAIDPRTGKTRTLMKVGSPRGLAVASDGTIYAVESTTNRVVHFSAGGRRLGLVGPTFGDPYALAESPAGLYVDDTSVVGVIDLVTPGGKTSTISAP
jgi:sugar lactone lactonase YvrE